MGDPEEEGDVTGLGIIAGAGEGFEPHIRHCSLGSDTGKTTLLAGLKTSGAHRMAVRNRDSVMKKACTDLLTLSHSTEAAG